MLDELQQRRLAAMARDGSAAERRQALERLLADFRGPALAAIHRTLLAGAMGPEHAEEALQAAVAKYLASGLEHYRGEAAPRTYFVRIAIHAALDLLRRTHRETATVDVWGALEARGAAAGCGSAAGAEQCLELARQREALLRCLESLRATLREAIHLYYFEEAGDCAGCATKLGLAKSAFEQRLCRGRLALAACVRKRLGD